MAELTTKKRNALKESSFALPPDRYPINDENHARNAIARGAQQVKAGNLSMADFHKITRAVHAKYPGIDIASLKVRHG